MFLKGLIQLPAQSVRKLRLQTGSTTHSAQSLLQKELAEIREKLLRLEQELNDDEMPTAA